MKKIVALFSVLYFSLVFTSEAQKNTEFGIKGGLNLTFFKVVEGSFGTHPETATGFYGGAFVDFIVEDGFSMQPELLYIVLNDFKFLNAPIYLKYKVGHNFNLLVGPSMNYFFDFFSNKLKIRADLAMSYDIIARLDVHVKYTLGFQEITPNGLFIGLGFKI
ncbi:hypothetical protein [Algibacter sp. 2305UL17-15]|uniref:hypothetical protein n=1 Tax=Algibacter sp. 2305UL17-15 TaxID=3231268 RepID=UPI00345A7CC7